MVKFRKLLRFMLGTLPGWGWKLPATFLVGLCDIAVIILVPLVAARIINSLAAGGWADFRHNLVLLAGLTFAQLGVSLFHRYLLLCIDERSANLLRQTLVETVFRKALPFFDKNWVGDIVSRSISDSSLLKSFISGVLLQMVYDAVSLVVIVVILARMNPTLALLTVATAPVTLVYGRVVMPRLEAATLRVRENVASVTGHLQSWLSRAAAVKAHSLEAEAARRFGARNDELTTNSLGFGLLGAKIGAVNATLLGVPTLLIFGYGGYLTFRGDLSIGALFAFMTFSTYFNGPIQRFINIVVGTLPTMYPVHERLLQLLDPADVEPPAPGAGPAPAVERVRADGLCFQVGEDRGFSLRVPSFAAGRGELVGIVGPNGSGKSTLGRLLAGMYQPQSGVVAVEAGGRRPDVDDGGGGRPAAGVDRRLVGYLPQETVVFDGTLLENLTLFDSRPDRERLGRITEELGMSEWVASLPGGLETEINAGLATKFSGGQLRKIGLCRVLYRDAPILLLDEPSGGLDQSARSLLDGIVERERASRVVIIITHAPEVIEACDRVYRLEPRPGEARSFECVERLPLVAFAGSGEALGDSLPR